MNGAPFYVMGYVDGVVLDSQARAAAMTVEHRRAASEHLIDVLADLHDVDVDDVGLGDLAKRDRVRRAPGEALDDAVGELEDPGPAGDRRGRPAARRADARAARGRDRPRRLPVRELSHRHVGRPYRGGARLGAVHVGRPARRRRVSRRLLVGSRPTERAGQRPDRAGGIPHLRRSARALRAADGTGSVGASTTTSPSRRGGWR